MMPSSSSRRPLILVRIVIGELPPLLFDPTLRLFPISFDAVPVHSRHLRKSGPPRQSKRRDVLDSSDLKVAQFNGSIRTLARSPFRLPAFIAALLLPL